ncbi:Clathrin light chain [Emydomyces testavorans]|uniref:Clathrin light chain n=1 Tax=Emydomyces testavorans TaxID=2070801 RepID=A0AAF0DMW4_9EURO|nr:Clathrin light chain [Emydomyces testavorans]
MADRFPSLDELGDQPVPTASNGATPATDSEDFLARERAVLGDDADQFVSANDHIKSPTVEDDGGDLLGGGESQHAGEDITGFESSFPALESHNERVAPGGTITGPDTFHPAYSTYQEPEEESEAVREWRKKRDDELSRRAAISAERKAATVQKAQEDIDDFYESYNKRTDKAKERSRTEAEDFLANREDTAAGGTSWERIAKLVDVSGKGLKGGASGSGKERFRELLLELRKDQNAPGANGI